MKESFYRLSFFTPYGAARLECFLTHVICRSYVSCCCFFIFSLTFFFFFLTLQKEAAGWQTRPGSRLPEGMTSRPAPAFGQGAEADGGEVAFRNRGLSSWVLLLCPHPLPSLAATCSIECF